MIMGPNQPSTSPLKVCLIIQALKLQGLLWQAALQSQGFCVLMESPEVDMFSLHLPQGGEGLINLLMIDIQALGGRPYVFCEYWREHYPQIKVVLTSSAQSQISDPERSWACFRGAADILPGIYIDKGLASLTSSLGRVLELMGKGTVNQEALIACLKSDPSLGLRSEPSHPASLQKSGKTLENASASKAPATFVRRYRGIAVQC